MLYPDVFRTDCVDLAQVQQRERLGIECFDINYSQHRHFGAKRNPTFAPLSSTSTDQLKIPWRKAAISFSALWFHQKVHAQTNLPYKLIYILGGMCG